ncbi:hypothetical protein Tco_0918991 [Tanacetum coccineum]
MSETQDENPPPPPPPATQQTPTQQTPHTVSTIKLPILKKGEYDIWAMKMEHYLAHTDYPIWEVIQNGNGPVSVTTDTSGQLKILPPKTAEEIVARERERKARTTLLMAIPEDHLAKFHKMTDAKEMWNAIKSRFGGNDESKKMQKYILKQQFEGFTVSNTYGIHKGFERFQSLLSQLEIHRAGVSTEDANQKFLRSLPSAWLQVSLIMRNKTRYRTSELVSEPVVNESNIEVQPKVWSDAPIIEEYESDSDDEYVYVQTKGLDTPSFANKQVKTPRENVKNQSTHSQKPKVNNKELGHGFTERACFVCGSFSHLIRDCDYHVKLAKQVELNKQNMSKGNGIGERKPTWNNVQRTVLTSTALKVNTVKPIVNGVRPANVFHKTHSPSSRPFKRTTVLRTNFSNQKVYTAKVKEVSTVGKCGHCVKHMDREQAYLADFPKDFNLVAPVAFGEVSLEKGNTVANATLSKLESEEESTMALELIRFIKKVLADLESKE